MNDKQFYALWGEALNYADRDGFISDAALSSIWGDAEDAQISADRLRELGRLWDAANMPVRRIRVHLGLTQAEFAQRYLIPMRTLQRWEKDGTCPDCTRLLLLQVTGLYSR